MAYVYRNGICIARSSVAQVDQVTARRLAFSIPKRRFIIPPVPIKRGDALHGATWGDRTACRRFAGLPRLVWVLDCRLNFPLFGVTMKGATVIIADAHRPRLKQCTRAFFTRSGEESELIPAGNLNGTPINLVWSPDCQQRTKRFMSIVTA